MENHSKMKKVVFSVLVLLGAGTVVFLALTSGLFCPGHIAGNSQYPEMQLRAEKALQFAERKGLNENYCIFLDYGIRSGKPRLFVWSFGENRVVYSGYAMHGPGKGSTDDTPVFSNTPGSNCSSLGRFEVTRRRGRRNKTGFYLKGLERSNSNAYFRGIMIHSSRWVDGNKWRRYIPLNAKCCLGCVTVSTRDMAYINRLMEKETDNLLLWTYYEVA